MKKEETADKLSLENQCLALKESNKLTILLYLLRIQREATVISKG